MNGRRDPIGTPVKSGFLNLFVVGYGRGWRLLRDAAGMRFYLAFNYNGTHKIDLEKDSGALLCAKNAAPYDPIVASALARLAKGGT